MRLLVRIKICLPFTSPRAMPTSPSGYSNLAALMGEQVELAIFRGFRSIGLRNLLYLQAEVLHLEEDLQFLATRDHAHSDRQFHATDWWSLSQGQSEGDTEQWAKILELRGALERYRESSLPQRHECPFKRTGIDYIPRPWIDDALLKQSSVAQLGPPRTYDLKFLREWLERPTMGAFPLLGLDRKTWDPSNESDLVAIHGRRPADLFSAWFSEVVVPFYHRLVGHRIKVGQALYLVGSYLGHCFRFQNTRNLKRKYVQNFMGFIKKPVMN